MLRRFLTISLLMLVVAPLLIVHAADPITAHVTMPRTVGLDPVGLGRTDSSGRTIDENLFIGLTRYNPATQKIEKGLAQDWTVSADQLTWTFKLRSDVQWVSYSNGTVQAVRPVVAADFVYGIRRACDAAPPNPVAHTIYVIAGCRNIATAASVDEATIAREFLVRAVDDQTLTIKLALTIPNFDVLVSLPEFRPVTHEAVEKGIDWTKPDTIMTDGPWALADGTPIGPSMTLVRNPLWPDKPAGNIERVEISFSGDSVAISTQVMSDFADFAILDAPTAVTIRQSKTDVIQSAPGQTVTMLGFSAERPIVQKAAFRQALSEAIDRAALVTAILPDAALPMSRFTPPGAIGGPTAMPTDSGFNADGAKAALYAGAGYNSCVLNARLQLLVDDQPQSEALANALIAQWKAVLGCSPFQFIVRQASPTDVQNVAHGAVNTADPKALPRPDMWIYSWSPDYPDANAWTGDAIHCQYGFIRTGIQCGKADALVDQAFLETDAAKRAELYDQAETNWFGPQGTFPVAPLYVSINYAAVQPWLKGATVNGPLRFDQWTITKKP